MPRLIDMTAYSSMVASIASLRLGAGSGLSALKNPVAGPAGSRGPREASSGKRQDPAMATLRRFRHSNKKLWIAVHCRHSRWLDTTSVDQWCQKSYFWWQSRTEYGVGIPVNVEESDSSTTKTSIARTDSA